MNRQSSVSWFPKRASLSLWRNTYWNYGWPEKKREQKETLRHVTMKLHALHVQYLPTFSPILSMQWTAQWCMLSMQWKQQSLRYIACQWWSFLHVSSKSSQSINLLRNCPKILTRICLPWKTLSKFAFFAILIDKLFVSFFDDVMYNINVITNSILIDTILKWLTPSFHH